MGKIAILGLGPSLSLFRPEGFDLTIGVNDIWRYYHAEIIVCVDHSSAFKRWPDRLLVINHSRPKIFYSQVVNWDWRPDFKKITILPGYPDRGLNLDAPGFYKSYCSPFVAVQIAYKLHAATDIHIYGVDLTNHPHLDRQLCAKIKNHFSYLFTALRSRGVTITVHGEGILTNLCQ